MDKALEALERIASKQVRVDHGSVIKHVTLEQIDPEAIATIRSALSGGWVSVEDRHPQLTVRLMSFPESNGKRNWTAMIVRKEKWEGLISNCGGITVARGELWNRVAYEAECTRFLLGERDCQPDILDYGDDIETPDKWGGETRKARETDHD